MRCWTASIPGPAGRAGLTGVCGLRCKGVLSASEIYLALPLTALTTPFELVGVLDYNTVFGPGTTILSADLGQKYRLRTWDNNTVSGHSRTMPTWDDNTVCVPGTTILQTWDNDTISGPRGTILFSYLGQQYCFRTWDNNTVLGPGTTILSADIAEQYSLPTWDDNTVCVPGTTILSADLGQRYY